MRRPVVITVAVTVLVLLAMLLVSGAVPTGASTYSARGDGLLAAYRYLEERGHAVGRWRRPARDLPFDPNLTLVLAAPWREPFSDEDLAHVENFLRRGGRIVYLTSGGAPRVPELAWDLRFETVPLDNGVRPPLAYSAWKRWMLTPEILRARPKALGARMPPRLAVRRSRFTPAVGRGGERLYVGSDGGTRVSRRRYGRGELLVIDNAGVFSNALISEPGNLELLEWLAARPGGRLLFDEFIHGQRDPATTPADGGTPLVGLGLQVLALYAGLVWALASRFGRPLADETPPRSSVARDLEALAALHRAAGHARQAGLALEEAARRLSPSGAGATPGSATEIRNDRQLLERAREIGRRQLEGRL